MFFFRRGGGTGKRVRKSPAFRGHRAAGRPRRDRPGPAGAPLSFPAVCAIVEYRENFPDGVRKRAGPGMNSEIRTVAIYSLIRDESVAFTIMNLVRFLEGNGIGVAIEAATANRLRFDLPALSFAEMGGKAELIIVVGGDGTMISAGREIASAGVPVLGINRGHLGFLTDLAPKDIRRELYNILKGEYVVEERFLLSAQINSPIGDKALALNEVVIHGVKTAHMIDFSILVDNRFMYSQKADGLIISTPTGSTAYNLSAGGPIIEPSLNALSLVPMFPQSMNLRPIILNGDSVIKVFFSNKLNAEEITVSCDGQIIMRANDHCEITIRKHETPIRVCHPHSYDYFKVLRAKLGFGTKLVG